MNRFEEEPLYESSRRAKQRRQEWLEKYGQDSDDVDTKEDNA